MSVSVDGFMEGPDREIDWHQVDDELHSHVNAELATMGAFLDGRVTYQLMTAFWPTADADPSSPRPVAEFARIWRDMPKIVYSRTLERADWNTTIVREVVVEEVMALRSCLERHDLLDDDLPHDRGVPVGPLQGSRVDDLWHVPPDPRELRDGPGARGSASAVGQY